MQMDDSGLVSAETEIVGQSSSQTFMHRRFYEAAAEGDIHTFTDQREVPLQLILTPIKNTVLHIHITARCEKKWPTDDFVENILDSCPLLLLQENTKGEIPLHIAARYGDCDIVKVLIEHGKKAVDKEDLERGIKPAVAAARDMIRMTNKDKDTALHEAVRYNHLDVVKLLINEDPEFSYSANDAGETPLYLAAERGFEQMVLEILQHCTLPAHGGPKGRTALHAAVIQNYTGITKSLLERKGVVITKEVDEQGWTPLHHAAYWDSLSMVKLLLAYDESMAYVGDRDFKRTALHIAVKRYHTNIVKEIISRCPDCYELVDKEGKNVLHYAVVTNSVDAINFFLEKTTSALTYLIHEKDDNGNTPLHLMKDPFRHHPLIINQRVDKMAMNKSNMSALDVILANRNILLSKARLLQGLQSAGFKAGRHNVGYEHDDDEDKFSETTKSWIARMKKDKGNQLVVATLIATVTFAAGFTLPGGYIQDNGEDQGTAVLVRKSAFQAFVVTDSLAMVFSISSVLLHFILTLDVNKGTFVKYYQRTTQLTLYAMIAMVAAFVSGLWVVLEEHSPGLAITTLCMGCLYFSVIFLHVNYKKNKFYRRFFFIGKNLFSSVRPFIDDILLLGVAPSKPDRQLLADE